MAALNPIEMQRYARHFTLPEVGVEGQEQLKSCKVLCVGAGGLASPALLYLAAAGVGTLGIIDADQVELSNFQRHVLFTEADVGRLKVDAALASLHALNNQSEIITYPDWLSRDNALEIIKPYDLVIDASDNFACRYLVNDACFTLNKPMIFAAIWQFQGQCSVFHRGRGPCYRCLFKAPPPQGLMANCQEAGVLGVLPGILGTIQATEAIKYLLNIGEPLLGRLLSIDALTMDFKRFSVQSDPNCLLCGHNTAYSDLPTYQEPMCMTTNIKEITAQELKQMQDAGAEFELIDVREPDEYDICNIGAQLLPLSRFADLMHDLNPSAHIVVHCKSGKRSQMACQMLMQAGFTNVCSLKGGILGYADEIDPSLTRY